MKKTFVYKLRPTKTQEAVLSETLETCRRLYNASVAERKEAWEERQESIGFARQCAALPTKKTENAFLAAIHSQVAQDVLHRVDRSFQAFFRHRRRKARLLLAKAHLRVQRARLDHAHKVAHDLVSRFDTISVEKLNIRGMVKNHPLAQAISDAGWGLFLSVLRAKAESAGKRIVEVNPAGTSQTCSGCGGRVPKALSVRWHSCPYCELSLHRDHNAAIRVLQVGGGTAVGR